MPFQGGPALPVQTVTGQPVQGGPAQPVVVVTSGPIAGGPAIPVQARSSGPVAAGPALPVFVVAGSLGGGAAVPAFSPTDITGLKVWYRADAITGVADGGAVATWIDSGPLANNAAEATNRPVYRATGGPNSRPCVEFDGINDKLTSGSNLGLSGNVVTTVFVVFSVANTTTEYGVVSWGDSTQALRVFGLYLKLRGAGVPSLEYAGSNGGIFQSYTTGFQLMTLTKAAGAINATSGLRRNGAAQTIQGGSSANTPNVTNGGLILGQWGSATFGAVKIAEAIVYDSVLSAGNIASVEAYLNAKYVLY
jgi:hypothetical protein